MQNRVCKKTLKKLWKTKTIRTLKIVRIHEAWQTETPKVLWTIQKSVSFSNTFLTYVDETIVSIKI